MEEHHCLNLLQEKHRSVTQNTIQFNTQCLLSFLLQNTSKVCLHLSQRFNTKQLCSDMSIVFVDLKCGSEECTLVYARAWCAVRMYECIHNHLCKRGSCGKHSDKTLYLILNAINRLKMSEM